MYGFKGCFVDRLLSEQGGNVGGLAARFEDCAGPERRDVAIVAEEGGLSDGDAG